jgi:putative ABC transport system substrate-binding protein
VVIERSDDREVYQVFESALRNAFPSHRDILILPTGATTKAELIIAIGSKAVASFSNSTIPVLNVMVSRAGLEKFKPAGSGGSSGIYMDQPTERQFSLLRAVFPQAKSIGVLISKETAELASIRKLSSASGIQLHSKRVSAPDQLSVGLSELLAYSDVLLVLPDAEVYRSDTIRNILLETYRQHVPMIGLSQNYVRAGALCAVYSTPAQIANQAAGVVIQYAQTRKLPGYQYPQEFEVAVNTQVARSLGVTIKSAEQLRTEIGGRP